MLASLAGVTSIDAQAAQSHSPPQLPVLNALLRTPGPSWTTASSRHFVVHLERRTRPGTTSAMLDSLEAAWANAVRLLDASVADLPRIEVLVTASRTRFPRLVPPEAKGLTTSLPGGGEVMILVSNDSVRAMTRHEVMHAVSARAWTVGRAPPTWLMEGLATFADGRCQRTTLAVVGRDLLRAQPNLSATAVMEHFVEMWQRERAQAYVLAGTLVDYLWASRGREGVRRLWQGVDVVDESAIVPGLAGELTRGWRAHVERAAGNAPGIDSAAFRRRGCS